MKLCFHRYEVIRAHFSHTYQQCKKCSKRKIVVMQVRGYVPIDHQWIVTGQFTPPPTTPPQTVGPYTLQRREVVPVVWQWGDDGFD